MHTLLPIHIIRFMNLAQILLRLSPDPVSIDLGRTRYHTPSSVVGHFCAMFLVIAVLEMNIIECHTL